MTMEHRIQGIYPVTTHINFELEIGVLNRISAGC